MPFEQHPLTATSLAIVARTAGDPMATASAFREIIRAINGDVPVRASTMDDTLSISVATPRFRTLLLGVFAALALILAIAGVYGVICVRGQSRYRRRSACAWRWVPLQATSSGW